MDHRYDDPYISEQPDSSAGQFPTPSDPRSPSNGYYAQPIDQPTAPSPETEQAPYQQPVPPTFPTSPNGNLPNSGFDPAVQSSEKIGRLSFIFGLISLFCVLAALIISETKIYTLFDILEGLGYLGYIVAVAMSIPGIILGVKSLNRLKTGNPLAKAGLILSIITVIIIVIIQVIISLFMLT